NKYTVGYTSGRLFSHLVDFLLAYSGRKFRTGGRFLMSYSKSLPKLIYPPVYLLSTFTSFRKVSVTIRYIGGFCMFPYRKILELHSEGVSLRSIATITQHSRQKVTEVIK